MLQRLIQNGVCRVPVTAFRRLIPGTKVVTHAISLSLPTGVPHARRIQLWSTANWETCRNIWNTNVLGHPIIFALPSSSSPSLSSFYSSFYLSFTFIFFHFPLLSTLTSLFFIHFFSVPSALYFLLPHSYLFLLHSSYSSISWHGLPKSYTTLLLSSEC